MKTLTLNKWILINLILIIILLTVMFFSALIGTERIGIMDALKIISHKIMNFPSGFIAEPAVETILCQIRIPRIIIAALVGIALAGAGCSYQALLRNPLADPFIIGISSGSGLAAIIAILFGKGKSILFMNITSISAFAGGLLTVYLVYRVSTINKRLSVYSLLLAGVVVNAFLSAIIMFITSVVSPFELHGIMGWLMGYIQFADYRTIMIVSIYILAGTVILFSISRYLNIISQGEEQAVQMGVNVERTKKIIIFASSLAVGSAVSVSGLIGFVGLIIPHIMRLIVGPDHRILMTASAIAGGIFLVFSDTVARTIIAPTQIPVGVVTAVIGGPFFIYLLKKKK